LGTALLVCAYENDAKFRQAALDGAVSLNDFERRMASLPAISRSFSTEADSATHRPSVRRRGLRLRVSPTRRCSGRDSGVAGRGVSNDYDATVGTKRPRTVVGELVVHSPREVVLVSCPIAALGLLTAERAIARVNARRKALLVGDPPKERRQLGLLPLRQGGAEGVLVLAGYAVDPLEHFPPLLGQVQGVATAVRGARPALEKPAFLQPVEQLDEAAGEHAKLLPQGLLAEAVGLPEHAEDASVRGRDLQRRQALCEPGGRMGSHLREKKSQAAGRDRIALRNAPARHSFLLKMVIDCND